MPNTPPSFPDPTLDIYLREIGQVDLLTAQEEKDLAREVADGSHEAFERLVLANLRFVVFVAKRHRHSSLSLMDLIAEGNVGLLEAVSRFDPDAGCRFTTYAYWRIRKCISAAMRGRSRVVHLPALMVDRIKGWVHTADAFREQHDREPTIEEMRDALELSSKAAHLVQRTIETAIGSVRTGGGQETWNHMAESVPDAQACTPAEEVQRREEIEVLLSSYERLEPRDRKVLELRFGMNGGNPKTLRAIGETLDVTHEAVRHIERRALARLHVAMRARRADGPIATRAVALS